MLVGIRVCGCFPPRMLPLNISVRICFGLIQSGEFLVHAELLGCKKTFFVFSSTKTRICFVFNFFLFFFGGGVGSLWMCLFDILIALCASVVTIRA